MPLLALLLGHAEVGEWQLYVLLDIEFVDEVEALEHEAYLALTDTGALALLQLAYLVAIEIVGAAGRIVEQTQDVEQGRLATARGAHDGNKLTFLYFERYTAQCYGFHLFGAKHLLNVF